MDVVIYKNNSVDHGWAWMVLLTSFICMVIFGFIEHSTGIIVSAILEGMDGDLSSASWVGSAHVTTTLLSGPVAGIITNKLGCRLTGILSGLTVLVGLASASLCKSFWSLIATYGILTGIVKLTYYMYLPPAKFPEIIYNNTGLLYLLKNKLFHGLPAYLIALFAHYLLAISSIPCIKGFGLGVTYNVCFVAVGQYFHRLRAVATGFTSSGIGIGIFIGPVIVQTLINEYSLNGMFLILGAVCFNITALSLFIRPSHVEVSRKIIRRQTKTSNFVFLDFMKIIQNKSFLCFFLSTFSWSAGESVAMMQLPIYAEEQGSTKMQAASLYTAYGSCSVLSRIVTGIFANKSSIPKTLLHSSFLGITGIVHLTFPLYSNRWLYQMFYAAAIGLCTGVNPSLLSPITVEIIGLVHLALGFGFLTMASGLAYLIVPASASFMIEKTGEVSYVFYMAGCIMLLGSVFGFLSWILMPRTPGTDESNDETIVIKTSTNNIVKDISSKTDICALNSNTQVRELHEQHSPQTEELHPMIE